MQLYRAAALLLLLVPKVVFAIGFCVGPPGAIQTCPDNWSAYQSPIQCFPGAPCACGVVNGNFQCVPDGQMANCNANQVLDCLNCICVDFTPTAAPTSTATQTRTITPTATITLTSIPTSTPTSTPSATITLTRTSTATVTRTSSPTATPSPTGTIRTVPTKRCVPFTPTQTPKPLPSMNGRRPYVFE